MRTIEIAILVTSVFAAGAAHAAALSDTNQTLVYTCTESETVTLTGSGNQLTVRGPCESLAVQGSGNTVIIDRVHNVDVAGDHNTVNWPDIKGIAAPKQHLQGTGNVATALQSSG